jgi:hypothetical protein
VGTKATCIGEGLESGVKLWDRYKQTVATKNRIAAEGAAEGRSAMGVSGAIEKSGAYNKTRAGAESWLAVLRNDSNENTDRGVALLLGFEMGAPRVPPNLDLALVRISTGEETPESTKSPVVGHYYQAITLGYRKWQVRIDESTLARTQLLAANAQDLHRRKRALAGAIESSRSAQAVADDSQEADGFTTSKILALFEEGNVRFEAAYTFGNGHRFILSLPMEFPSTPN